MITQGTLESHSTLPGRKLWNVSDFKKTLEKVSTGGGGVYIVFLLESEREEEEDIKINFFPKVKQSFA